MDGTQVNTFQQYEKNILLEDKHARYYEFLNSGSPELLMLNPTSLLLIFMGQWLCGRDLSAIVY